MEHTLSLPNAGHHIAGFKTCDSYYSNNGPVKERLSKTEMNIPSAKRGRSAQDHLTKRERRALRKAEREGTTQSTGVFYNGKVVISGFFSNSMNENNDVEINHIIDES